MTPAERKPRTKRMATGRNDEGRKGKGVSVAARRTKLRDVLV